MEILRPQSDLIQISTKFLPRGTIKNKTASLYLLAWCPQATSHYPKKLWLRSQLMEYSKAILYTICLYIFDTHFLLNVFWEKQNTKMECIILCFYGDSILNTVVAQAAGISPRDRKNNNHTAYLISWLTLRRIIWRCKRQDINSHAIDLVIQGRSCFSTKLINVLEIVICNVAL